MQKLTLAVAMAAAVLGATAGAQKIEFDGGSFFNLQNCYFVKEGLRCDFTYTDKKDRTTYFPKDNFEVVTPDGATVKANKIAYAGAGYGDGYSDVNLYSGVPIKFSAIFDVPTTTRSLAVFSAYKGTLRGVPIGGATPVTTPRPAAAAAVAVTVNSGDYNITLTGCKGADGRYTCTGATVTPRN